MGRFTSRAAKQCPIGRDSQGIILATSEVTPDLVGSGPESTVTCEIGPDSAAAGIQPELDYPPGVPRTAPSRSMPVSS